MSSPGTGHHHVIPTMPIGGSGLSRSRVLKDDFVDFERGDLTSLKAFEGWLDATDELAQLLLVIGSDDLASSPTI